MYNQDAFKPGDKVQLVTGDGPIMVIDKKSTVGADEWVCTYWNEVEKRFDRKNFKTVTLTKVQTQGN